MSDNFYEKENNYERSYQLKTRQYNNSRQSNYLPKAYEHYKNFPSQAKTVQQDNRYEQVNYEGYGKSKHESQWEYKRHEIEKNVLAERNGKMHERQRGENYQPERYNERTMMMSEDQHVSNNSRRDNARKQELQIKMNNINLINDKISSLLNMVKKDRVEYISKEKSIQRPTTYGRREHSPLPNRSRSPMLNRQTSPKAGNNFQQTSSSQRFKRAEEKDPFKENCKSIQRLRALSSLEPTLHSNNTKNDQSIKLHGNNQEDGRYVNRNPSPAKNLRSRKFLLEKEDKYEEQDKKAGIIPYKYPNSPKYESILEKDPSKAQKFTPSRYDRMCQKYEHLASKQEDYSRNTPKSNYDQSFMPITIEQEPQQNQQQRYVQNYSGMKMIDEQLKRIKQKIHESQGQNVKCRQRFAAKEEKYKYLEENPIETENRKNTTKFELKVQPVEIDRTQTIKIAEKMAFQIELDNRIRAALPLFQKIAGQQKWRDFELKVSKNGIKIPISQIKQYLSVFSHYPHESQERSTRKSDLVEQFCEAQQFWNIEMTRCASSRALRSEGFNVSELDSRNKGFLSIQDLVSFTNLYTGRYYSNHDLALIYCRLDYLQGEENSSGIILSTFTKALTL